MGFRFWKVGELAKTAGVTVRTLHHYEDVGILSPSHRNDGGHRVYGEDDIRRLQQILSLRQLGFPLDEIRICLTDKKLSPLKVVRMHRTRVEEEREKMVRLHDRLTQLEHALETQTVVSVEEFIETIEVIQMFDKYFTKEQLTELEDRKNDLGQAKMDNYGEKWKVLMDQVRSEMNEGTNPAAPHVQKMAAEWNSMVLAFTGGNPGIKTNLQQMYVQEPKMWESQGLDSQLWEYVGKMMQFYSMANRPK